MKAMVLREYKRLELEERPAPEVGAGEVLVAVAACGICGSDVHGFDGSTGRRIPPLVMMEVVPGDALDPEVERDYMAVIQRYAPSAPAPQRVERHAFYVRARSAFAIVMTGETRKYGNLLLKKGVTPVA